MVIERTAHPAVAGGHAFIVGPADELHALAADATVVYRVTYNGTDGDGLASFTQSPGIA